MSLKLPLIATTLIGFVGGLVMLFLYDWWIGFYCLALLVPLFIINHVYPRRSYALNKGLNDQLEREVAVLTTRRVDAVRSHYRGLGGWRVTLSNAEAANWGVMELFVIVAQHASMTYFLKSGREISLSGRSLTTRIESAHPTKSYRIVRLKSKKIAIEEQASFP